MHGSHIHHACLTNMTICESIVKTLSRGRINSHTTSSLIKQKKKFPLILQTAAPATANQAFYKTEKTCSVKRKCHALMREAQLSVKNTPEKTTI